MTREEASNILNDFNINFEGHTAEEIAEAFDVAFRALEQEPCEDAISREAAEKAFMELPHEYKTKEQRARTGGIAACQVIVEELPSVQPKTRAGHWELPEMACDANIWRKCSCCGVHYECFTKYEPKSPSMYAGETFYSRKRMNFCPNCGAKMEEGEE